MILRLDQIFGEKTNLAINLYNPSFSYQNFFTFISLQLHYFI